MFVCMYSCLYLYTYTDHVGTVKFVSLPGKASHLSLETCEPNPQEEASGKTESGARTVPGEQKSLAGVEAK